jgi:3-phosphoshikimate 1-carboxyvinyltransferase
VELKVDGEPAMAKRPIKELLNVLRAQGAVVSDGFPYTLKAAGLKGGDVELDISASTQFASGLLMAAPYAKSPLRLKLTGDRTQIPYIEMTAGMMKSFGVDMQYQDALWQVPLQPYSSPGTYVIEPDFSGAAYFFAAAALVGGKVTVKRTSASSIQGDIRFLKVLQHMGCEFYEDPDGLTLEKEPGRVLKGVDVDMNAFSDQALTLAALAPFCDRPVSIRNVAHIRKQECDRIEAIVKNLRGLGVTVDERPDGVTIHPGPLQGGTIETFGDHRVAMAFSLVGLRVAGIQIDHPECVAKTFENYWDAFAELQASHA